MKFPENGRPGRIDGTGELIIRRTREQIESRPWPSVSNRELEQGVPLFLTQGEKVRVSTETRDFAGRA